MRSIEKYFRQLIAIGLFFSPLLALCAFHTRAEAQQISKPDLTVGDSWTSLTVDDWSNSDKSICTQTVIGKIPGFVRLENKCRTQVNAITKKIDSFPQPTASETTIPDDFNSNFRADNRVSRRINFDWPLSVGKKWTYTYETTEGTGASLAVFSYNYTALVSGWETLSINNQSYKVLKIVHDGNWSNKTTGAHTGRTAFTYWYSPELKRWIKYAYESDTSTGEPSTRLTTTTTEVTVKR